jgi:hypothetical protein
MMQTAITDRPARRPAFHGCMLLRLGFVVAPILFGLDKFFSWMVVWPTYLAPWLDRLIPNGLRGDDDRVRTAASVAIGPGRVAP